VEPERGGKQQQEMNPVFLVEKKEARRNRATQKEKKKI